MWNAESYEFRIKPTPEYVPYKNVEKLKSKWFMHNGDDSQHMVTAISLGMVELSGEWIHVTALLKDWLTTSGKPAGDRYT
jgi:hypothetical protein